METAIRTSRIKDKLISEFEASKKILFGNAQLRDQAMESFCKQGIPTRKHEEYKYTHVDLMLKEEFYFSANKNCSDEQIEHLKFLKGAYVAIIENGVFIDGSSNLQNLPKGLTICSLAVAAKENLTVFEKYYAKNADVYADAFIALNTAMAKDGVFIHITKNAIIEKPIHIIHISTAFENTFINPRNLIVIDENAQAKIIESFETLDSTARTFSNALTEIVINKSAIVDHYKIQDENDLGYLVNTTQIIQKKQSVFSTHTFMLSGSLVRNNLTLVLDDEHIESHLNGLYLTAGNQVVDNHTVVDHRKPNCNSNELYKGIIDGKSIATFNGKIFVRKDAQKTNAFQSNKNILLSETGTINTKPQLEIYADDVKCSHGTSTGKLDKDKIFYLRARGLSTESAKKLLMHAFASEVVDTVKIEPLREYIEGKIFKTFE
ncbi:Fe-S cluster assembly protein SufD [Pedobacter sp. CG_S7]|uniref:Fe-S cluster assembly protein SufD n=1 Tax=Pedobacter sp. CG_S7 TaxID=3143930 RepID=UPI003390D0F2